MCNLSQGILEMGEVRGLAKGEARGLAKGEAKKEMEYIRKMYKKGYLKSLKQQIAECCTSLRRSTPLWFLL